MLTIKNPKLSTEVVIDCINRLVVFVSCFQMIEMVQRHENYKINSVAYNKVSSLLDQ